MIQLGEALLLLKGWRDANTSLVCESTLFSIWSFGIRGMVDSVSDDGVVRIVSADRAASLTFRLSEADGIEYGESPKSRIPLLVVAIPLRPGEASTKRDKLSFFDIPEDI